MQSPKWLIFTLMAWIILALLGGVIEGAAPGAGEASTLNTLMNSPVITEGRITAVISDGDFLDALKTMLTFDFAMFEGEWELFRWVFFIPLSISMMIQVGFALLAHIPFIGRG